MRDLIRCLEPFLGPHISLHTKPHEDNFFSKVAGAASTQGGLNFSLHSPNVGITGFSKLFRLVDQLQLGYSITYDYLLMVF